MVQWEDAEPATFQVNFSTELPIEINLNLPGPKGDKGDKGDPGDVTAASIGQLADVEITNLQDGDTIVYSNARFRNTHIENLTDGGNF
jgi:hypothetical protein